MALRSMAVMVLGCLALAGVGCGGGSSSPPLVPDAHDGAHDGGESSSEPNAAGVAELGAGAAAPSPGTAGAAADSTPAAAAAPAAPEPVDECSPVAVDFEKRARPKLKDCYGQGKKKEPNLEGTVKLSVDIDTLGKVKTIKIVEKTLPEPVAQCMLKALKSTPLPDASKCPGKSLTIPITFPTPR